MAIAFVQSNATPFANPGSSPVTCAYTLNVTAGNLLVVFVNINDNTGSVATFADTIGNVWTLQSSSVSNRTMKVYSAISKASGANTITINATEAGTLMGLMVSEYSGVTTVDQIAAGVLQTGTSQNTPAITTTQANELLLCVYRVETGSNANTINSPFTQRNVIQFSGTSYCFYGDRIVSSVGSYTANLTSQSEAAGNGNAVILSFYALAVDGTPVVSPADVIKVIIYNQNSDGTLSSALSPSASTPKISPVDAAPVWVFNTVNADGTLTSSIVS